MMFFFSLNMSESFAIIKNILFVYMFFCFY